MDYFSKTVILHQTKNGFSVFNKPLSGICRLEREDGVFKVYLTFINVLENDNGEFFFCLTDQKGTPFYFSLGNQPKTHNFTFTVIPYVEKGFSASLFFVNNNLPVVVAFSKFGVSADLLSVKRKLYEKYIKSPDTIVLEKKEEVKIEPTPEPQIENQKLKTDSLDELADKSPNEEYNDEALATENYYENDEELKEKLAFIEKFDNLNLEDDKIKTEEVLTFEKESAATNSEALSEEEQFIKSINLDDIGDESEKFETSEEKNYNEDNPYYETVKEELNDILSKFPAEKPLANVIPNSKFVKVNYAENKYYTIGIIYQNKKERYICYGVPDRYSKNPPKELKGYCQFVPISMFNISGEGYWMMFQDAITGDCVKMR